MSDIMGEITDMGVIGAIVFVVIRFLNTIEKIVEKFVDAIERKGES